MDAAPHCVDLGSCASQEQGSTMGGIVCIDTAAGKCYCASTGCAASLGSAVGSFNALLPAATVVSGMCCRKSRGLYLCTMRKHHVCWILLSRCRGSRGSCCMP